MLWSAAVFLYILGVGGADHGSGRFKVLMTTIPVILSAL